MTNGALALLRKLWASLMAWEAAMDYSAADYTNDRIGGLEREVEQLKDELRRTRMSAGAADGGFEPVLLAREPIGGWRSTSGISWEQNAQNAEASRSPRSAD
jgi:uncharacterized small protein (DUF1192 family)